jgi:CRISPR/Cas system-associated endoribonuclease Cas2
LKALEDKQSRQTLEGTLERKELHRVKNSCLRVLFHCTLPSGINWAAGIKQRTSVLLAQQQKVGIVRVARNREADILGRKKVPNLH